MVRSLLAILLVLVASVPIAAAPSRSVGHAMASPAAERSVVVHYWRPDGDYDGWNLWVWNEGAQGRSVPFKPGKEDATATFTVEEGVSRLGFLVRKGDWERKDIDQDRFIELKPRGRTEVWLAAGQAAVLASAKAIDRSSTFVGAFLDGRDQVTLVMTGPMDDKVRKAVKVRLDG
ncbi:MAG: pullulanase-associated domain-containing protein, partial [Phycisphaerales bacterium]